MACNCRTTSLRMFVQSLTRLPISGSNPRPSSIVDTRLLGAYKTDISRRPFTATSAAHYPRQTFQNAVHVQTDMEDQDKESHETSHFSHTISAESAADASAVDIERAKSTNAIIDLSSEAIDALAADMHRSPNYQAIHKPLVNGTQYENDVPRRQKAELSGPSRLKRSKIMPAEKRTMPEPAEPPKKQREVWQVQKEALVEKFPDGWSPRKKLSPDALDGIRALHIQYPQIYTTEALSNQFQVSPEAIRRILRSKWKPNTEEDEKRQERWYTRGKNIWSQMAELGTKPPKRWREAGVSRDARFNEKKGPKMEYPYVPKWKERESAQRKLGDRLL